MLKGFLAAIFLALSITAPAAAEQLLLTGAGGVIGGAPPPPVTFSPGWWYDGRTPPPANTALDGQTTQGLTWQGNAGSGTNTTAIFTGVSSTSANGRFDGSHGAAANGTFDYIIAPITASKWVARGLSAVATLGFGARPADYLTFPSCCVTGTNSWTYIDLEQTSLGLGSLLVKFGVGIVGSATPTSAGGPANTFIAAGDIDEAHYYPCPSGFCVDVDLLGQLIEPAIGVSGTGVDFSQTYRSGWNGAIGTQYRYLAVGDPATQAMITSNMPNRVVPVDVNGDFTPHFAGTFTLASLGGLTYSLLDPTTYLPIGGFSNLTATLNSTSTAPPATDTITGSITGTSMSVASLSSYIHYGDAITGGGAAAGTYMTGTNTCLNNAGIVFATWGHTSMPCTIVVSPSQTVGSATFTVTHTQAPAGTYTATGAKIVAASIPASFVMKTCRADITAGQIESCTFGPVQIAGENHFWMGQSIPQQGYPFGTDFTWSTSVLGFSTSQKSYYVDGGFGGPGNKGSAGSDATQYEMRSQALALNSSTNNGGSLNKYNYQWMIGNSSNVVQTVRGGIGGTTAYQRAQAGSLALVSFFKGIDNAGGDLTRGVDSSGTFDASTSCPGCTTDYAASRDSFYSQTETYIGHSLIVAQVMLGASQGVALGAGQAPYDTIRRIQYNQGIAGGRYCPVSVSLAHLAHKLGDQYHLDQRGTGEHYRLGALAQLDCKFGGTTWKRGLYLNSVVEVDDHTADVTFDAPNAAGAQINNQSNATYGGDQGLNFGVWNGSSLTTALGALHSTPGSTTCGAVASSQVTCRFVFAGTPFAGALHVAVTGQRGSNPFNLNDAVGDTINNSGTNNQDYWSDAMNALMAVYPSTAVVTGSVTTTTLTVTAVTSGTIHLGDWMMVAGSPRSIEIVAFGTGAGGTGTYTIQQSATGIGTTFTSAEPMVPIQPYFKVGGSSTGSDDFVTSP